MLELTQEQKDWWATLDMNCPYLCKMWHGMFGTSEQRVTQLYIIRKNQGFTLSKKVK